MELTILDAIDFHFNLRAMMSDLHIKEGSPQARSFTQLAEQAQAIARPKACYLKASFHYGKEGEVIIGGIPFISRVLQVKLEGLSHVFPHAATCGRELEHWSKTFDDFLARFWTDYLMEQVLYAAQEALEKHLIERFNLEKVSSLSPGSLEDWPLSQQRPLFDLLAEGKEAIGITLSDNCLMLPIKSISGIYFPCKEAFVSCQHCPRQKCAGRRAAYQQPAMMCLVLYDALSSDHLYRQTWPTEKARQSISEQAGKHFDPHVVEAFLKPIDTET